MRRRVVAGNWKMNKTCSEAISLARSVAEGVDGLELDVVVGPVATVLHPVCDALGDSNVGVAAQNVHWAESGAFTGELSCEMVKETGCEWVIVGHSERRQYFGETDEGVNRRAAAALEAGLTPIVCFGEHLAERESGWTQDKVRLQVLAALSGFDPSQLEKVVLAYEPIWAIGTGVTATPEQAQEVHAFIRSLVSEHFGDVADSIRILYGGSVKPHNIEELISQPDIDGALVGGASLDSESFSAIARACV